MRIVVGGGRVGIKDRMSAGDAARRTTGLEAVVMTEMGQWIPEKRRMDAILRQTTLQGHPIEIEWTEEHRKALAKLKTALTQVPALGIPDYNKPFALYETGLKWPEALPITLYTLRNQVTRTTGLTPFEILMGRPMTTGPTLGCLPRGPQHPVPLFPHTVTSNPDCDELACLNMRPFPL
eukprot:g35411.t1